MIGNQLALIKRELWEHRSIYVTPISIAVVILLMTLTGQVTVSAFGDAVDLAIVGASNTDPLARRVAMIAAFSVIATIFAIGAGIVMVFHSLDALYAERKDKSILFWRSMPITDAETVISKLLTVLLLIPLVTLLIAIVTHVLVMILLSIWVMMQGGNAVHLIWSSAPLADIWTASLVTSLAMPLWLSPFVGWFLFVSAFTKRSPMLIAFLPVFVAPLLEKLVVGSHLFYDAIVVRTFQPPLADLGDFEWMDEHELPTGLNEDMVSVLGSIDLSGFLSSPSLWVGLVVCGLFVTAAIYVRRFRDESY